MASLLLVCTKQSVISVINNNQNIYAISNTIIILLLNTDDQYANLAMSTIHTDRHSNPNTTGV